MMINNGSFKIMSTQWLFFVKTDYFTVIKVIQVLKNTDILQHCYSYCTLDYRTMV